MLDSRWREPQQTRLGGEGFLSVDTGDKAGPIIDRLPFMGMAVQRKILALGCLIKTSAGIFDGWRFVQNTSRTVHRRVLGHGYWYPITKSPFMQINEALKELGVSSDLLTAEEKHQLDTRGYLPISGVLSKEEADQFRRRLDLLVELEGVDAGKEVHQEAGTARLANLVDKAAAFRVTFTTPKVLAAVAHVLDGDMKLSSLNSRTALPGQGLQGLHADWGEPVKEGNYQGCNTIWMLDDFTPDNGATRVVDGTHRSPILPREAMDGDTNKDHPEQKLLNGPKGTVVVFNAHTWHGGTLNRTDKPRHAMHCFYCRRNRAQQTDQRKFLSLATIESFSPAIRCLLDVE